MVNMVDGFSFWFISYGNRIRKSTFIQKQVETNHDSSLHFTI